MLFGVILTFVVLVRESRDGEAWHQIRDGLESHNAKTCRHSN